MRALVPASTLDRTTRGLCRVTSGAAELNIVSDSKYVIVRGVNEWIPTQLEAHSLVAGTSRAPFATSRRLWHDLDAAIVAHAPGVRFLWVLQGPCDVRAERDG